MEQDNNNTTQVFSLRNKWSIWKALGFVIALTILIWFFAIGVYNVAPDASLSLQALFKVFWIAFGVVIVHVRGGAMKDKLLWGLLVWLSTAISLITAVLICYLLVKYEPRKQNLS